MNLQSILAHCDHTLLNPCATWEEIHALCDEGMKYRTASVCIPPSYVRQAKEYVKNALPICTVIGFPNGYCTTEVKCFEAAQAVENGADEIDMVINLGFVKEGRFDRVLEEIRQVKAACDGRLLKVIIETCFLTEDEIIALCKIVTQSGADYIKTSTGFGSAGAKPRDIELFRENIGPNIKIKAAGGIASLEDAARFLEMGASRLGTSRIVKLAKKLEQED